MKTFGLKDYQIKSLQDCFRKFSAIEKVILYGSRAMGNYRINSDIDLAIVDHEMTFSELSKLETFLDDLLLPYKIDLSLLRQIENETLKAHIDRVGQLFYLK